MKKHIIIFFLIFFVTIGFATLSTVLDIKGNVNIAENLEDFKIEITNLKINNDAKVELISANKKAFTFTGTGNDTLEYTVTNYSYQYDTNINLVCTPNDNVTIEQINNLSAQNRITKTINTTNTSEITCTINVEKISRTDYAEDMCKSVKGTEWTFDYTGKEQEFVVPCDGNYKIELWGAQGATLVSSLPGGKGGYTTGNILLDSGVRFSVYVGLAGTSYTGTNKKNNFNGGGNGNFWCIQQLPSAATNVTGGGATDIRLIGGDWNNAESLKSRIMVAAGGGASTGYAAGGDGGTLNGNNGSKDNRVSGNYSGIGGTQSSGGSANAKFGVGGDANYSGNACSYNDGAGGGSGYYGGGGSRGTASSTGGTGGGGSSFISGHTGCNAINSSGIHTGQPNHYSGYVFTNTRMIAGNTSMPSYDGNGAMTGNTGNGYAKITYLGK